jgi:site-specific DNA-cytosine methylase
VPAASPIIIPEPARRRWPEAEIVADPVPAKKLGKPVVLVKRRRSDLCGPSGEELIYLDGPSAISLFTGAGGFDIGLEQAGFVPLVQHEWETETCRTLIANRPNFFRHAALIQGDIRETPTSMILGEAGLRVGEAHLLAGGPPCQGFSFAGKRDPSDVRNTLVFEYLRVVREAMPRFFIMENVPGFCKMSKGAFMKSFLEMAYGSFYELVYGIANAVEHGVPQNRNRFLCMGTRRDLFDLDGMIASLPAPSHFHQTDLDKIQAIESAPSLFPGEIVADAEDLELLRHPPGIRYFPDRPVLAPPGPCQASGRNRSFLDFFRKLRREEPDRIVTLNSHGAA